MDESPRPETDDEISLVDLARVLYRRRRTLAIVALLTLAAAGAWSQLKGESYEYTAIIDLTSWADAQGNIHYLEGRETAVERLNQVSIPASYRALPELLQEKVGANTVEARITGTSGGDEAPDTGLITLGAEAGAEKSDAIRAVQNGAVERLKGRHAAQSKLEEQRLQQQVGNHERRLESLKEEREEIQQRLNRLESRHENEIEALKEARQDLQADRERLSERRGNAIAALEDESEFLRQELQRLEQRRELVQGQLDRTQELHDETRQRYEAATGDTGTLFEEGGSVVTFMLLDGLSQQLAQQQQRIDRLSEELTLGIPEQRAQLEQRIHDTQRKLVERKLSFDERESKLERRLLENQQAQEEKELQFDERTASLKQERRDIRRQMDEQDAEINNLFARLDSMQPTRMVLEPSEPENPVGAATSLIVALGAVLGGMLGLFSAFFHEFIARVRETTTLDETG